jgi:salicylate hydroxylase
MPAHILVAGGGIGGLATALALSHAHHRADVFEQAAVFAEVGAGIQIGPNVTRRLWQLGLGERVNAIAARPQALVVHSAGSGAELARLPLGDAISSRYGAPYLCVHRADLHSLLLDAVRAQGTGTLVTDARIAQVEMGDDLVCISSSGARAWEGEALVGADGLWSMTRQQLESPSAAEPPRVTGHTAWRGLVAQAELPQALRRRCVDVWLGPRLHVVAYPVRSGDWLNVVVIAESAPAGDARDWDQVSSLAALQRATGRSSRTLQALLEAMPGWRAWTLCDRAPLACAADMAHERIALVGDAAHPMVPYLAQGAGMAIEDAVALAEALAGGGANEVPAAFARYAEARWQRNALVQARARRNGQVFHAAGPVRLGRDLAMRVLGARLLDQPWLYGG